MRAEKNVQRWFNDARPWLYLLFGSGRWTGKSKVCIWSWKKSTMHISITQKACTLRPMGTWQRKVTTYKPFPFAVASGVEHQQAATTVCFDLDASISIHRLQLPFRASDLPHLQLATSGTSDPIKTGSGAACVVGRGGRYVITQPAVKETLTYALVQFKLKKMVCPPSHVSMTKVQIPVSNLQHRPAIRFEIFSWHQLNWMTHPFIWKYSGSQKFLLTPFFDTCQGRWFLWRGGGWFRRNKKLHSVGIGRWSPSDGPEEYALKMLIR